MSESEEPENAPRESPEEASFLTPWRGLLLVCAFVGIVVVGYSFLFASKGGGTNTEVRINRPPHSQSTPGGESTSHYNRLVDLENQRREQQSVQERRAHIPTITRTTPSSDNPQPSVPDTALQKPPVKYLKTEPSPTQPPQSMPRKDLVQVAQAPRSQAKESRLEAMRKEAASILESWDFKPHEVNVVKDGKRHPSSENALTNSNHNNTTTNHPASASSETPVKPGDLLFAVNELALNSDSPGPAMATVVSGRLKGARLLGGFERRGSRLVLQFNRIRLPETDNVHSIDAVAVDPDLSSAAVASSADHHRLERWGGLIAASFLEGLSTAIRDDGTVTVETVGEGSGRVISERDFDSEERALVALGKTGERLGDVLEDRFDRAPTVTLNPGVNIGVLVL